MMRAASARSERDAVVFSEVIERADRQDAEGNLAAGERAGDRADGAVASGRDHGVGAVGGGATGLGFERFAGDFVDGGVDALGGKRRLDGVGLRRRVGASTRAGIEQHVNPHAGKSSKLCAGRDAPRRRGVRGV